jgi:hypothetical protein
MRNLHFTTAAVLVLLSTVASAEPIIRSNYLYYSYREHFRAYGINSLFDGSLPPDEFYYDPCYQWVRTTHGLRQRLVCR